MLKIEAQLKVRWNFFHIFWADVFTQIKQYTIYTWSYIDFVVDQLIWFTFGVFEHRCFWLFVYLLVDHSCCRAKSSDTIYFGLHLLHLFSGNTFCSSWFLLAGVTWVKVKETSLKQNALAINQVNFMIIWTLLRLEKGLEDSLKRSFSIVTLSGQVWSCRYLNMVVMWIYFVSNNIAHNHYYVFEGSLNSLLLSGIKYPCL